MEGGHPHKPTLLLILGKIQSTHSERLGDFSDLENSILNLRKAVELSDDEDPHEPTIPLNLENSLGICFEHTSILFKLKDSISNVRESLDLVAHLSVNVPD